MSWLGAVRKGCRYLAVAWSASRPRARCILEPMRLLRRLSALGLAGWMFVAPLAASMCEIQCAPASHAAQQDAGCHRAGAPVSTQSFAADHDCSSHDLITAAVAPGPPRVNSLTHALVVVDDPVRPASSELHAASIASASYPAPVPHTLDALTPLRI